MFSNCENFKNFSVQLKYCVSCVGALCNNYHNLRFCHFKNENCLQFSLIFAQKSHNGGIENSTQNLFQNLSFAFVAECKFCIRMNPSNDNPLKNDQVPMENMNLDPLHDAFKKHFDSYFMYAASLNGSHPSSQDHFASGLHQLS